jgi:uncharacterized protein YdaU (DUF1376 family)
MAEAPIMPFFTDAYLADTGHLSTIEHGAYMLILIACWRAGGTLPNDDKRLARYAHLGSQQWQRIKPVIMEFFQSDGEQIWQGRLMDELVAVRRKSHIASNNARAKYRKNNKTGGADAPIPLSQTDAIHDPLSKESKKVSNDTQKKPTPRSELCAVLDDEHAEAVIDHRQRLRKPLSARAAKLLAGKFGQCADPNAAADVMIGAGWQGFEPGWLENRGTPTQPAPNGAAKPKPMDSDPEIIRRRAEHAALEKDRLARLAKEIH